MKWTQNIPTKLFYGLYYIFLGCEHLFAKWFNRKSSKSLNALRNTFQVAKRCTRQPFFPKWNSPFTTQTRQVDHSVAGCWTGLEYHNAQRVILYLHGGTYTHGQLVDFLPYADQISHRLLCPVFTPNYGQAPQPSLSDMMNQLQHAVEFVQQQFPGQKIYLLGDGAGGGLCFRLMNRYVQLGRPIPFAKCAVYSPFFNLACDGLSMELNRSIDARNHPKVLQTCGSKVVTHPVKDPWRLEWTAFPSCRIVVSDDEILFDDSVRIYYFLHQSVLTIYQNLFHGFQHFWKYTSEARDEFGRLDEFLGEGFTQPQPT